MNELLEKEKRKDKYLLLFSIVIFLFAAFVLAYYFWQKNQDTVVEIKPVLVAQNRQPPPQINEEERRRRLRRIEPLSSTTKQQEEALFKCTDPATGSMTLAHLCPRGFTAEKIETQDSTGIKPARLRRPAPSSNTQQNQITVIPNVSREIKKCDDYYNPKIKRVLQLSSSEYMRRKLAELRENKEQCIRAANTGNAIIYPVIV